MVYLVNFKTKFHLFILQIFGHHIARAGGRGMERRVDGTKGGERN